MDNTLLIPDMFADQEPEHFENDFNIIKELSGGELEAVMKQLDLDPSDRVSPNQLAVTVLSQYYGAKFNCQMQVLLVEDKKSYKRYNATRLAFREVSDADFVFHDTWRFTQVQQHKCISRIYKLYVESKTVYIVREHFTDTLLDFFANKDTPMIKRMNEEKLIDYMKQIASGVYHLHNKELAVGNISPKNIYATEMYTRLLVSIEKPNIKGSGDIDSDKYLNSAFVAPEIRKMIQDGKVPNSLNVQRAADMFSMGVIFFGMLINRLDEKTLSDVFLSDDYINQAKEKLDSLDTNLKPLTKIVTKLFHKDPEKRMNSSKLYTELKALKKQKRVEVERQRSKSNAQLSSLRNMPAIKAPTAPTEKHEQTRNSIIRALTFQSIMESDTERDIRPPSRRNRTEPNKPAEDGGIPSASSFLAPPIQQKRRRSFSGALPSIFKRNDS